MTKNVPLNKINIVHLQIYDYASTEYVYHASHLFCNSILPEQYFSEKMITLRKNPKILYESREIIRFKIMYH